MEFFVASVFISLCSRLDLKIASPGETADTLNALRYCKERGALCVGITNTGELKLKPEMNLYGRQIFWVKSIVALQLEVLCHVRRSAVAISTQDLRLASQAQRFIKRIC